MSSVTGFILDRRATFYAADCAADRWSLVGKLPVSFRTRRVALSIAASLRWCRGVTRCMCGWSTYSQTPMKKPSGRWGGYLSIDDRRGELDAPSGQRHHQLRRQRVWSRQQRLRGGSRGRDTLELAGRRSPMGAATDIYAGAINLYKCTIASGTTCTQGDWINLTYAYWVQPRSAGGAGARAPRSARDRVHGGLRQCAGYFAHDGGISRTLDGYAGLNTGSCAGTNQFDSLSQSLGSMTEFVSFWRVSPTSADILLGGTQDNGSPKTSGATGNSTWQNALGGDGGFNAINPQNPDEWFAARS